MSSTRYAADGSESSPHRWASSPEYSYGLNAGLVAKRAGLLSRSQDRELVWFLHELSHRTDLYKHWTANAFPVWPWEADESESGLCGLERVAGEICQKPETLATFCLNPAVIIRNHDLSPEDHESIQIPEWNAKQSDVCYSKRAFYGDLNELINALKKYKLRFESASTNRFIETSISRKISQTLDYAMDERCMVLIQGNSRIGKSVSAQMWAQRHLGRARYVQLEATTDEQSFFACIARALGMPNTRNYKAWELRNNVLRVLESGDLLLIIDEADHLWPRTDRPRLAPSRIDWINTALVNHGVPVALIGTPKFSMQLELFDKQCPVWASEQFVGRLADQVILPSELPDEELESIARHLLPSCKQLLPLVGLAKFCGKYVATIEHVARKARGLARERNLPAVNDALLFELVDSLTPKTPKPVVPNKFRAKSLKQKPESQASDKLISGTRETAISPKTAKNIFSSTADFLPEIPRTDHQELSLLP